MSDIMSIGVIRRNITRADTVRITVNCYLSYNGNPIVEIETPWTRVGIHVEDIDPLIDLLKKAQTYWQEQVSLPVSDGNEREN